MSFLSSVSSTSTSLFATTTTAYASTLRPFANLDLTEQQRSQIRSIFQQAKSQGLSQAEVQQQIAAVLTPTQQSALQSDLQQLPSTSSSTQQSPPNPLTDPNGPFANLDLTSSQQSQISQIFQNARSHGLTFDQVNAQISAILTTSQQATFKTDLANLPSPPSGGPGGANGSSGSSDPLSDLSLTASQQTTIDQILQQVQGGTLSQSQALTQITNALTPTQQTLLQSAEQTAQTSLAGHRHHGDASTSTSTGTSASSSSSASVPTLASGLTETDVKNQVAAANAIILNELEYEVNQGA